MSLAMDEAARGPMTPGSGGHLGVSTNSPDPTIATMQMMMREISSVKDLSDMKVARIGVEVAAVRDFIDTLKIARDIEATAMKELMLTRFNSIDKAIALAHENEQRWPTVLDREINALKEFMGVKLDIHAEKFISVNRRFEERDRHVQIDSAANKTAIDAAFKAASEAVKTQQDASDKAITKSEAGFVKQIESATMILSTMKTELDRRLDENKERTNTLAQEITSIQASQAGRKELTVEKNDNTGMLVAVGGFILALVVAAISFVANRGTV